jgi:enoyl-CoA hydratase/carnithine racemase
VRQEASGVRFETIAYDVDNRVATIAFNRPDQLNAINLRMKNELGQAFAAAEADENVWLIIVTGNGRAFCAGADVAEIPEDGGNIYAEAYLSTYEQWEAPQEATPPFRTMTKPILTAVNGLCCGAGLDLVTTGDIVLASDRAQFRTSASAWWPGVRWYGWPGCCRERWRCAWRSWGVRSG